MSGSPSAGKTPEARGEPAAATAFPRCARLLRPRDFQRVFQRPLTSGDRYFRVLARPADNVGADSATVSDERPGRRRGEGPGGGMRLGMAVSRKVDRRASVRNRIKRVIRESFRRRFAQEQGARAHGPGLDFVVLPRAACATISNAELFGSLERHWTRIMAQFDRTTTPEPRPRDKNP